MPDNDADALSSFRFDWKWLIGPIAIIAVAGLLILFFPLEQTRPTYSSELPPQPITIQQGIDVAKAKEHAQLQCAQTYDCSSQDCLEKLLTHVDSASISIEAVLRTPSPKEFRDHLRLAIKRGVRVDLVLDASLNPSFLLEGATIRVKNISHFIGTNFLIVDRSAVLFGSNPRIYAAEPDVIHVVCEDISRYPYFALFDRVWATETIAFNSETVNEEILSESELSLTESEDSCSSATCGPDTYTCVDTTKVWQHYSCMGSCLYEIIPLYFSYDCGYTNPGFGPDGSPLVIITETEVDEGFTSNEFIEFTALQPLELSNFSLLKDGNLLITFPTPYILNGSAKVFTGKGVDSTSIIYLNQTAPLWKTIGTTATLVNPFGDVVAAQTFEG
ncbi:MAG: TrmB family transcriptional regulator sugar-binding domain-containing protein [Candidatus Diapherotrites archaeon]